MGVGPAQDYDSISNDLHVAAMGPLGDKSRIKGRFSASVVQALSPFGILNLCRVQPPGVKERHAVSFIMSVTGGVARYYGTG